MKISLDYIDSTYKFKGEWDIESKCGLKIIQRADNTVVIVTELPDNPGTQITSFSSELAQQIAKTHNINPEELVYIEHSPDMQSKLSFYSESFYLVNFEIENGKFSSPQWEKFTKEQVDQLMAQTSK